MKTPSAALRADPERATRIGRVKFVALPLDESGGARADPAPYPLQRILRLLRRLASRVDGRPMAARP